MLMRRRNASSNSLQRESPDFESGFDDSDKIKDEKELVNCVNARGILV